MGLVNTDFVAVWNKRYWSLSEFPDYHLNLTGIWVLVQMCGWGFRGRTHIRIKGQNLNFYLESHAATDNIYFIRLRSLPRNLVHYTGACGWPLRGEAWSIARILNHNENISWCIWWAKIRTGHSTSQTQHCLPYGWAANNPCQYQSAIRM